ncbi:hypothetical protein [Cupriavidus sp. IDO]|uniref:hypothetical protein n=1 Tax=Cupriavidus sp. IDO TaxID=1539142 RepID=UPI0005794C7A|nr:hypothetical protein [Cupriavidus sp. IDO]KWR91861.1 hypothetical protein RM96_02765 [Cupriavidus sp. IDO]
MRKNNLMAVVFTMLLGACGGGGDGGSSSNSASTQSVSVPLQTAVANEVNNGITVNFSISGTVSGVPVTGSGTLKDDKPVAATFNGAAALKTTETVSGTITVNGVSAPFSVTTIIFRNPATFAEFSEDLGDQVVDFPDYTYPATVKAGDSATLVTGTAFSSSARTTKIGTVTRSYSVAADTSTSLLVTFTETDFDNNSVKTADAQTTFRVDTMGNIQFVSEKVTGFAVNGQQGSLTFQ